MATAERFLIVDERPLHPADCLVLEDGSAVICSVSDKFSARAIAAGTRRLNIRQSSTLSEADQDRVTSAFRAKGEAE